jgi:hypothetical protein
MLLQPLQFKNVINIIGEKTGTAHSPLLVLADDFGVYYLKTPQDFSPEFLIINEFLCAHLLNLWGLKIPKIAALKVDTKIIDKPLSSRHKEHYFSRTCFGSMQLKDSFEFSEFIPLFSKHDFNKFIDIDDILKISLFDIWVDNIDRHSKNPNILIAQDTNGLNIFAIDHTLCFCNLSAGNLSPEAPFSVPLEKTILNTDFAMNVYKLIIKQNPKWVEDMQEYFYLRIKICKDYFDTTVGNIPSDLGLREEDITALSNFMFSNSRNKLVFSEFCRRLIT